MQRRRVLQITGLADVAVATGLQAQQPQYSSIIFHWDSLPQDTYPRTRGEKQRIESLILEAGIFLNSKIYVQEPLDIASIKTPVEIYFNEAEKAGIFYAAKTRRLMNLNPEIFASEGLTLGTAFHEDLHLVDAERGLMPAYIELNQREVDMQHLSQEEIIREWRIYKRTKEYQDLKKRAKRESVESEIRAYEGEIKLFSITKHRQWSSPYALLMYESCLYKDLTENQEKLEQLNKQIAQG